jgi:trigger factor
MASAVKTTVTELPESRVRLEAEVPPDEVNRSLERTAKRLGRDLRIPGFRKGKVPAPMVVQRLGREAVLDEAVRGGLSEWYMQAIDDAGVSPVGDPDVDIGDLPPEGQPLTFTVEIGVRPTATLGDYKGLEVPRREPAADAEAVDRELETLRERLARLEAVDRPAEAGDFITMDYVGSVDGEPFEGGEGRDQVLELGSGRLIPGFEDGLLGATAGEERTVDVTFPEDYGAEHLAGQDAQFAITVKEVKAKVLPELDDELASDGAGFDTLDELREDIAERLRAADEDRVAVEFREAALDAAVANATVEVPEALTEARAAELFERMMHSLSHQGLTKEIYLQISGKTEEELLEESKPDAERALRRESVVAAIIEAESIEPTEEAILAALEPSAEREKTTPKKLRERLKSAGRLDDLLEDLSARAAIDLLADEAKPVAPEAAEAKEKLWTPEKESAEGASPASGEKLWTPGD